MDGSLLSQGWGGHSLTCRDVLQPAKFPNFKHLQITELIVALANSSDYENDVLFSNDTGKLGKRNSECWLLSGIEPKTFRLLVRMLYHSATGDSWELRPLN